MTQQEADKLNELHNRIISLQAQLTQAIGDGRSRDGRKLLAYLISSKEEFSKYLLSLVKVNK